VRGRVRLRSSSDASRSRCDRHNYARPARAHGAAAYLGDLPRSYGTTAGTPVSTLAPIADHPARICARLARRTVHAALTREGARAVIVVAIGAIRGAVTVG